MASKKIYKVTGFDKVIVNGIEIASVPPTLNDCSWEQIHEYIDNNTLGDYFSVGDIKNVVLSTGEIMQMILASINDGSGVYGAYYPAKTADFISKNAMVNMVNYTNWYSNLDNTKLVPWTSSGVRSKLNSTIFNRLPSDLREYIVPKTHKYEVDENGKNGNRYQYYESSDKLWLPTAFEMGAPSQYATSGIMNVNKVYPIFQSANDRKRYYNTRCTASLFNQLYSDGYGYKNISIDVNGGFDGAVNLYWKNYYTNEGGVPTIIGFRIG